MICGYMLHISKTTQTEKVIKMYQRDVSLIKDFVAVGGPDALVDGVVRFVLTTIQAGLSTCTGQAQKIIDDGLEANCLWGKKSNGLAYARDNKDFLYGRLYKIAETHGYASTEGCVAAIELFITIPNLGLVKAAFVAQCLGFDVACLDSHNLARFGIPVSQVKDNPKAKIETRRKKWASYVQLCRDLTKTPKTKNLMLCLDCETATEYWWNSWCSYVAGNQANRKLNTGDIVSYYHVECVTYGFTSDYYSSY